MKTIILFFAFSICSIGINAQSVDSVIVHYNASNQNLNVQVYGRVFIFDFEALKSINQVIKNDTIVVEMDFRPCSPWQTVAPYDTNFDVQLNGMSAGPKVLAVHAFILPDLDTTCYYLPARTKSDSKYVPFNIPIGLTEEHIEKINIYPNPSNGYFFVDVQTTEKINFAVYSATGRLIIQNVLPESKQISLEQFQSGVYFLRLKIGENHFFHKIIMQ